MIINKKIELACEGCGAKFMYNEDNAPTAVPDHPETWHGERVDETECIRRHNARQAELDSRRAEMKDKMERLAQMCAADQFFITVLDTYFCGKSARPGEASVILEGLVYNRAIDVGLARGGWFWKSVVDRVYELRRAR